MGKPAVKRAVGLKGGPWWPPQPHGCFVQANGSVKYQFEVRLLYTIMNYTILCKCLAYIHNIYIYCIYIYIVYIGKVQRCTFCILHPDPTSRDPTVPGASLRIDSSHKLLSQLLPDGVGSDDQSNNLPSGYVNIAIENDNL